MEVLGGWVFSYGRGTPVQVCDSESTLQEFLAWAAIFRSQLHDKWSLSEHCRVSSQLILGGCTYEA